MDKPKISFVIPTYNRPQWIMEGIQSLQNQTVKEIEIIIVNADPTGMTGSMIDWAMRQDKRIKEVQIEKSPGIGLCRNLGNNVASAEIIAVADDDDLNTPDRAEKTLKFFEEHPDIDIVTGSYIRIGYNNDQQGVFNAEELDIDNFKKSGLVNYFCHPASAYRKKEILEHPYKAETDKMSDDIQMVRDFISRDKKFGIIKDVLCLHRVLPDGYMTMNMRGGGLE